jgi:hypothetical protein
MKKVIKLPDIQNKEIFMNIITILLYAHSGIRWLIIVAALLFRLR